NNACPACKVAIPTGRFQSQVVIREKFERSRTTNKNQDLKAEADNAREVRSSLVHGGKLKNRDFKERVENVIASLQSAAVVSISEATKSKALIRQRLLVGLPFTRLSMRLKTPQQPEIAGELSFENRAAALILPDEVTNGGPSD